MAEKGHIVERIPDTSKTKLDSSLRNWAEIAKENTNKEITKALLLGVLSGSEIIDKFSTWLLVGSGATIALMISNIDKITPILKNNGFRLSVLVLTCSILFGFLEKALSIYVAIFIAAEKNIQDKLSRLMEQHSKTEGEISKYAEEARLKIDAGIDFNIVLNDYKATFPRILQGIVQKSYNRGVADRNNAPKRAVKVIIRQSFYGLFQFILLIIFIIIVVFSLNAV